MEVFFIASDIRKYSKSGLKIAAIEMDCANIREKIIVVLKHNSGISAFAHKIKEIANLNISQGVLHGHIRSLKRKGLLIENNGRYYYKGDDNY